MTARPSDSRDEAFWRDFLTRGSSLERYGRLAARLASAAGAGEILTTSETADVAGLDQSLERKPLELKGKHQATEVVTLRIGPAN